MAFIVKSNVVVRNLSIGPLSGGGNGGGGSSEPSYLLVADSDASNRTGTAFLYDSNDYTATPTTLTDSSLASNDRFGRQVAGTSDLIAVSAPGDDNNLGAVYVYSTSNPTDAPVKLVANNRVSNTVYGEGDSSKALTVSSRHVVVGATHEGTRHGAVYIYDVNNLTSPATRLFGAYPYAYLGSAVEATEDYIIVGAVQDSGGSANYYGAVYVYDANNLSSTPTRLGAPSGADNFGYNIATNDTHFFVGASRSWGTIYRYDLNNLSAAPTVISYNSGENFGYSIAATNDYLVVGDYGDDDQGENAGAVYVYDATNLSATPTKVTVPGTEGDRFGASVSIVGSQIAVGTNNGTEAYIFNASNLSAAPTTITGNSNSSFGNSLQLI